ncbi:Thiol-disulfide isomerase or thioredoxin [Lachnospiraceae bacterium]|nr:Thiol-disulfide isomerase or thioredoxin [Lachnospiraceae bacterium]
MKKALIIILIMFFIITGTLAAVFFSKTTFLSDVSAAEVTRIEIFDGNNGTAFSITDPYEIEFIVGCFKSTKARKTGISLGRMGYTYNMQFMSDSGEVLEEFILNSSDTIRKDPFFYQAEDYICFDRIQSIEEEYLQKQSVEISSSDTDRPNADTANVEPKVLSEMDIAPDFTAELVGGGTFKLSDYDDKIVLLNIWATWCPPCVGEMPAFEKLKNDANPNLEIICINCMEDKNTVDQFIKDQGYTFNVGYDTDGRIEAYYPTDGIPYTLVINKGKIYRIYVGANGADEQYQEYKKAIDECAAK